MCIICYFGTNNKLFIGCFDTTPSKLHHTLCMVKLIFNVCAPNIASIKGKYATPWIDNLFWFNPTQQINIEIDM